MNLVSAISRLSLTALKPQVTRCISTDKAMFFKISPCLFAEPLKKKKKLDPAIVKSREDRKKKKIEKQIRRLEKNSRQLKPVEECEISVDLADNKKMRQREDPNITDAILEGRILLEKKWAKYKRDQHLEDIQMLDRITFSQQRALDELQKESEELYQEAIQIDFMLLPFKTEGPVVTSPVEDYIAPDGDYLDASKKW